MIRKRDSKIKATTQVITSRLPEFNRRYRKGPSLYFYKRLLTLRRGCQRIGSFLSNNYHLEILYALLVSWDMDSRGAKMKSFADFKGNLLSCKKQFEAIEHTSQDLGAANSENILDQVDEAYSKLSLMESSARLVSNSKCLHFLFPSLCMPMDGSNTLQYFYGNIGESRKKYREILQFSFELIQQPIEFGCYLDDQWNQTIPKLVDNAIILLRGTSVNRGAQQKG